MNAAARLSRAARAAAHVQAAPQRWASTAAAAAGHGHAAHAEHHHADHHGEHDHGHHDDHSSELARKYHNTQSFFLGEEHPHPSAEGWEKYHVALLAGTALWIYLAGFAPNTNPHDWARDEAEERVRRRAAGEEVLYGVNYAALRVMKEKGAISAERAAELTAGAVVEPAPVIRLQ